MEPLKFEWKYIWIGEKENDLLTKLCAVLGLNEGIAFD